MQLRGKTAVVTGGGTGIGLGVAIALAGEGCRVAIGGRRRDVLERAAAEYRGPQPLLVRPLDVAQRDSIAEYFRWVREQLGHVDVLVNAAGINVVRRLLGELDPADWDRMLAINATGAFLCMREVLPEMAQRGDGLIVNISSISGLRASTLGGVGYCASKFAMAALNDCATLEYGRQGVRVTGIYPGEVDTPILEHRPQPVSAERRATMLKAEDVAAAVLMIAKLPPRAHVHQLIIKPTVQDFA
jgi:NADP-dependent 3-hydroxy acid dehydrogenase YdfG